MLSQWCPAEKQVVTTIGMEKMPTEKRLMLAQLTPGRGSSGRRAADHTGGPEGAARNWSDLILDSSRHLMLTVALLLWFLETLKKRRKKNLRDSDLWWGFHPISTRLASNAGGIRWRWPALAHVGRYLLNPIFAEAWQTVIYVHLLHDCVLRSYLIGSVLRRAPPGRCQYEPRPVRVKSRLSKFVPQESTSAVLVTDQALPFTSVLLSDVPRVLSYEPFCRIKLVLISHWAKPPPSHLV